MKQIKIFWNTSCADLEDDVNVWLAGNEDRIRVLDVQYKHCLAHMVENFLAKVSSDSEYSVCIVYEEVSDGT